MTAYFQPRIPYRFTNADADEEFVFPLSDFSWEWEQGMRAPDAELTGAHGSFDLLGEGEAPRNSGVVRVAFTVYDEDPTVVDSTVQEMMDKVGRFGRGKLWSKGGGNGDVLRWTYARATAMPQLQWSAGMVVSKSCTAVFRCGPWWFGDAELDDTSVTATGVLHVEDQPTAGDTLTIGATAYEFVSGTPSAGEIEIGANLAATQANIVAAINGSDMVNSANARATAGAFSGNNSTITALVTGYQGTFVAFSETFTSANNTCNGGGTLGGTVEGVGSPYYGGQGFTVNNPGNAPITDCVIRIEGSWSAPNITNTTTGYTVESAGTGSTKLEFDAGGPSVRKWNGSAWVNDYANFVPQAGQVQLMVLAPGNNVFTNTGCSGALIYVEGVPAYTAL